VNLGDLEKEYGASWHIFALHNGVAASRKRRSLTNDEVAQGFLYALIAFDADDLCGKLTRQPDHQPSPERGLPSPSSPLHVPYPRR
jgi:hypothetical protein